MTSGRACRLSNDPQNSKIAGKIGLGVAFAVNLSRLHVFAKADGKTLPA
jgi:hypothetical protein